MSSESSVSVWIAGAKVGDPRAAQEIFARYFERLLQLARRKLEGTPRAAADEEDVAISALASFCRGARSGRFPELVDREGLWRLLMKITVDKAIDQQRRALAKIRGGGRVLDGAALPGAGDSDAVPGIAQVMGNEPTPELAAMLAESFRNLLGRLDNPELVATALAKLEGYRNQEIARKLDCALRTVERRLMLIRDKWTG